MAYQRGDIYSLNQDDSDEGALYSDDDELGSDEDGELLEGDDELAEEEENL